MQAALKYNPDDVYNGTSEACLGYLSHPDPNQKLTQTEWETKVANDKKFFRDIARQGNAEWFGKLMADHTGLDWRDTIRHRLGDGWPGIYPEVLVIASEKSGCFPSAGPLEVVRIINTSKLDDTGKTSTATGVTIDWGGHWCYWEDPEKFIELVVPFLEKK
jgi:pimeloyl-ACP methyl ester carboxylesterase